jgi:SAM-dependent methyltransferase
VRPDPNATAPGECRITDWLEQPVEADDVWESAYVRFETPSRQIRKFLRRLRVLGADRWPLDARIVELFCGRGSGLNALERLGFTSIEGVDLSRVLLRKYSGPAHLYAGDCRSLRFDDASKDIVLVHGGLHHLPELPGDLEQVLREVHRVLRPEGRFGFVEPWLTPFLRLVHATCSVPLARRLWPRLDALAEMIEREGKTYHQWLARQEMILLLLGKYFATQKRRIRLGKILYVGKKRQCEGPARLVRSPF